MMIVLAHCGNGYCDTVTLRRFSSSKGEEYSDEDYEDYLKNYVDFDWRDATYEKYVEWCENWGYEPKEVE